MPWVRIILDDEARVAYLSNNYISGILWQAFKGVYVGLRIEQKATPPKDAKKQQRHFEAYHKWLVSQAGE